MYEDAGRWGYLFQSYVLLTMMELHHKEVVHNYYRFIIYTRCHVTLEWYIHVHIIIDVYIISGAYEPPKASRSVQLRRTAFAFTRI